MFPVLLTIMIMWGICAILTATVPDLDLAIRTDGPKLDMFHKAEWFRFPTPCEIYSTD